MICEYQRDNPSDTYCIDCGRKPESCALRYGYLLELIEEDYSLETKSKHKLVVERDALGEELQ